MYHVGQAYASAWTDCEVQELSSAYNEATRLAVSRMEQEVRELGAHGAYTGLTMRTWIHPRGQVDLPTIRTLFAPDMGPFFVATAAIFQPEEPGWPK